MKEIIRALDRRRGQTQSAAEYVEAETKDLEWFAFKRGTGEQVKGTKKELLAYGRQDQ